MTDHITLPSIDQQWGCYPDQAYTTTRPVAISPGGYSKPETSNEPEDTVNFATVNFAHCVLSKGDTLVFIDFPNTRKDPRRRTNCEGIAPTSQSFWVHSKHLFALADSKFARMLDDEIYQARVKRRRKPNDHMMKGVKYLLDLTPPSEGDDLVFQMTELSLTPGIVNWWSASILHHVPVNLVRGHDDICTCWQDEERDKARKTQKASEEDQWIGGQAKAFADSVARQQEEPIKQEALDSDEVMSNADPDAPGSQTTGETSADRAIAEAALENKPLAENLAGNPDQDTDQATGENTEPIRLPPNAEALLRLKAKGENQVLETPPHYRIPDYCPFRHRNSIIRLLMMIEGNSVSMNSAARVWSMVGMSKIFECPSVVRDQVAQWIMSNTTFIEVLPEEALSIGFTLQLPQITQSAFRILVNELALAEAASPDKKDAKGGLRQYTVFGRRLGDPGDERSNLIQHAARAFVERVNSEFAQLQNPDLFDFGDLCEWKKLRAIEYLLVAENLDSACENALSTIRRLMSALVFQITSKVWELATNNSNSNATANDYLWMDNNRATYVEPREFEALRHIIPSFTATQKLLCPFFYKELGRNLKDRLYLGQRSAHPDSCHEYYYAMLRALESDLQRIVDRNLNTQQHPSWKIIFSSDGSGSVASPLIDLANLTYDVKCHLWPFHRQWDQKGLVPPIHITRHMTLALTNNEMKFLPLWAGGNDDGTGGVFESFLPPAEMGPSGPGPAYHTGLTVPSAPTGLSGSLIEDISAMKVKGSITQGSVDVNDSISTAYRPDKVIAAGSSLGSERFSENDSEYGRAKFEVPMEHQGIGQSVDVLVETPYSDSDDTLSDATEIANVSDDEPEHNEKVDDRSTSTSDSDSMLLV